MKVTWNFSGNGTFFKTKSSLIKTDENFVKLTNILKMKTKDQVWRAFEDINAEYKERLLFGGRNCWRETECNFQKLEDLQNQLNLSKVSSASNTKSSDKEILEASMEFSKIMYTKLNYESNT